MNETQQYAATRFFEIYSNVQEHGLNETVEELEHLLPKTSDPRLKGDMAALLGFYWLRQFDFKQALALSDLALECLPVDAPSRRACAYNAMYALLMLDRYEDVVERGRRALEKHGEDFLWHGLITGALAKLGRVEEARRQGTETLRLKDAVTTQRAGRDLRSCPVSPFDPTRPERNIISFSLFGTDRKYVDGALLNAQGARFVYLGWTCRFYIDDSVSASTVHQLQIYGAQVVRVSPEQKRMPGTLWRFLVADDPGVDRYIIRDVDSVVSLREAVAVQEWVSSGKHFHVMRDSLEHYEIILAGMWGGVSGAVAPMEPEIWKYLASLSAVLNRTTDQEFLREILWPTIRQSALVHDSQFDFGERRDFPAYAQLPSGSFVGCPAMRMLGLDESY